MNRDAERILIVDDEPELRRLLNRYLAAEGYRVAEAENGVAMQRYLDDHDVDLVILDLMMPGEDGLTLARRLRNRGDQPIIILSARGDDVDRIVGLEVGADDYLAKPFNPRELLARIRAVLRRTHAGDGGEAGEQASTVRFGSWELNLASHRLTRDGEEVALTSGEFELLKIFVRHPDRVLTRDQLLTMTKGYEHTPYDRSIDVRVNRLRRKIEEDPSAPRLIRTIWGSGYCFSPDG